MHLTIFTYIRVHFSQHSKTTNSSTRPTSISTIPDSSHITKCSQEYSQGILSHSQPHPHFHFDDDDDDGTTSWYSPIALYTLSHNASPSIHQATILWEQNVDVVVFAEKQTLTEITKMHSQSRSIQPPRQPSCGANWNSFKRGKVPFPVLLVWSFLFFRWFLDLPLLGRIAQAR